MDHSSSSILNSAVCTPQNSIQLPNANERIKIRSKHLSITSPKLWFSDFQGDFQRFLVFSYPKISNRTRHFVTHLQFWPLKGFVRCFLHLRHDFMVGWIIRIALPDLQSFAQLYLSKDFSQERDLTLVKLVKRIKWLVPTVRILSVQWSMVQSLDSRPVGVGRKSPDRKTDQLKLNL